MKDFELDEALVEEAARDFNGGQDPEWVTARMTYSAAVSLKRIADKLDKLNLESLESALVTADQGMARLRDQIQDVQTYGLRINK